MLKIINLEAGYGKLRVLKKVSMHVAPGEIVTLIGANGAGKTTLLSTIAGLVRASGGEIFLQGENIEKVSADKIVYKGCSLVPEGRQVFSTMLDRSMCSRLDSGSDSIPTRARRPETNPSISSRAASASLVQST